jgi:peptidyl-prolyl cis-trans isomerase C
MRLPAVLVVPLLPLLLCTACHRRTPQGPSAAQKPEAPLDPAVAASVNGVALSRADLDAQVDAALQMQAGRIPPAQLEQARRAFQHNAVQGFVVKSLATGEAKRLGVKVEPADREKAMARLTAMAAGQGLTPDEAFKQSPMGEQRARQEFEDGILIDKLIDAEVRSKVVLPEAEVDALAATRDLERGKQREALEALRGQIVAGTTNFEAAARARSDCPSREKGGDLGTFGRGQMVKPFEDAAFGQKIGEVGPLIETQFGFHIVKVMARHPATNDAPETVQASHILLKAPAAAAREDVRNELLDARFRPALQTYLQGLQARAKIQTMFDAPAAAAPAVPPK